MKSLKASTETTYTLRPDQVSNFLWLRDVRLHRSDCCLFLWHWSCHELYVILFDFPKLKQPFLPREQNKTLYNNEATANNRQINSSWPQFRQTKRIYLDKLSPTPLTWQYSWNLINDLHRFWHFFLKLKLSPWHVKPIAWAIPTNLSYDTERRVSYHTVWIKLSINTYITISPQTLFQLLDSNWCS